MGQGFEYRHSGLDQIVSVTRAILQRACRACVLFGLLYLIGGCATSIDLDYDADTARDLTSRVVQGRSDLDAGMLVLRPEVRALIDERIKPGWGTAYKVKELRKFLFNEDELFIQYGVELTKTAQETFDARVGNCLSLTSLFIAAARHIGVDAHFQTVSVKPSWDYQQNTLIRYEHIVATGRVSANDSYVVDFLPEFSLTGKSSRKISDRIAMALYFNNIGGEQLILGNTDEAINYLQQAIYVNREFSAAWNNIGAAYRRIGDKELTEFSYWKAISLDRNNFSALNNLARFYESQNQFEKSDQFISRVMKHQASNPYYLAAAGTLLFNSGEFDASLKMLARSIDLKPDEPGFYLTTAEVYEAMGESRLAAVFKREAELRSKEKTHVPVQTENHRIWPSRIKL